MAWKTKHGRVYFIQAVHGLEIPVQIEIMKKRTSEAHNKSKQESFTERKQSMHPLLLLVLTIIPVGSSAPPHRTLMLDSCL